MNAKKKPSLSRSRHTELAQVIHGALVDRALRSSASSKKEEERGAELAIPRQRVKVYDNATEFRVRFDGKLLAVTVANVE